MHISLGVRLQIWGADEHDLAVYCNGLVLQVYISILSFKSALFTSFFLSTDERYVESTLCCLCALIWRRRVSAFGMSSFLVTNIDVNVYTYVSSPIGECPLDYVDPHVGGGAQLAFPCRMVEAAAMVNFLMGTSQHYRRC